MKTQQSNSEKGEKLQAIERFTVGQATVAIATVPGLTVTERFAGQVQRALDRISAGVDGLSQYNADRGIPEGIRCLAFNFATFVVANGGMLSDLKGSGTKEIRGAWTKAQDWFRSLCQSEGLLPGNAPDGYEVTRVSATRYSGMDVTGKPTSQTRSVTYSRKMTLEDTGAWLASQQRQYDRLKAADAEMKRKAAEEQKAA